LPFNCKHLTHKNALIGILGTDFKKSNNKFSLFTAVFRALAPLRDKKGPTSGGGKNIHANTQWRKAKTNNGFGNSYQTPLEA